MQKGRGGMGMRKHGKSGWKNGPGKSPRFRLQARLEAESENNDRKRRRTNWYDTVADAFNSEKPI